MSATDELRSMLDERGIAYETDYYDDGYETYSYTRWGDRWGDRWQLPVVFTEPLNATPNTIRTECELTISPVTPAQAIAATIHDAASTHAALLQESNARMALQMDYNNQIKRIQNQRKQLREMQEALERHDHRRTAHVLTTTDDDGVGHSECGGCRRTVGEWFKFCPWCGARFTDIERSYRP
jgi:hypothetical protein